jgi:hypothetical protein
MYPCLRRKLFQSCRFSLIIAFLVCYQGGRAVYGAQDASNQLLGTFNQEIDDGRFSLFGDASMWLGAGVITEFNDNINLDPKGGKSDFILRPNAYCRFLKPLTEQNELNFIGRGGFTRYLKHSQYNSNFVTISPDTALSLTFYVRELECVLKDQFSYLEDATTSPLINQTVSYKRFENNLSLSVKWPINEKTLSSAIVSREDVVANSKAFKSLGKTVYRASFSGSYRVVNALWLGATVGAYTEKYKEKIQNNNKGTSFSLDLRSTLSEYLSASGSVGVDKRSYEKDGTISDDHNSVSSLSFSGTLEHRLTPYTQHSLKLKSVPQSGFGSNFYKDTEVSYLIRTQLSQKVSSGLNLIYQYSKTSSTVPEKSQRYFIVLLLDLNFLRDMAISLQARHLQKKSNLSDKSYKENRITLDITYSL